MNEAFELGVIEGMEKVAKLPSYLRNLGNTMAQHPLAQYRQQGGSLAHRMWRSDAAVNSRRMEIMKRQKLRLQKLKAGEPLWPSYLQKTQEIPLPR
jgi:hypothetical protein